jgi:two-component system, chemotaxis family, protein-glutamate methylesterase/glutaminase
MPKIKVLIVDDSALVRQALSDILSSDPGIEVIGMAQDPIVAVQRISEQVPDVITLDVEMPRMDGITFLQKLMSQHPIPVVMCSSLTESGSETALKAMEYGAVDIITKPKMGTKQFIEESRIRICDSIKAAAAARIIPHRVIREVSPKYTADVMIEAPNAKAMILTTEKIVAVGASTGGTEALSVFLQMLPEDTPGIVIVQHMPENFTAAFAKRLNSICKVTVKEAENNDSVVRGHVLIAPGNKHTLLKRSGARYYVEVKDGPLVSRHRPSVDVLFRSAARYAGKNAVGIILTGMGDDGAHGMKEMHDAGSRTIAQDEATCVVFGMPNEAIKQGGVDKVMPLDKIAAEMMRLCAQ